MAITTEGYTCSEYNYEDGYLVIDRKNPAWTFSLSPTLYRNWYNDHLIMAIYDPNCFCGINDKVKELIGSPGYRNLSILAVYNPLTKTHQFFVNHETGDDIIKVYITETHDDKYMGFQNTIDVLGDFRRDNPELVARYDDEYTSTTLPPRHKTIRQGQAVPGPVDLKEPGFEAYGLF